MTFIKPDGTKDTFAPVRRNRYICCRTNRVTGSLYFFYAPDMAGNWSVSFTMPAQNITDILEPYSIQDALVIQPTLQYRLVSDYAGLLNGYPWAQLPNSNVYWSYPINSNNREWSAISGDWLGSSFNRAYCLRCH